MKATNWLCAVWQILCKWSKIATIFRHRKRVWLRNVKFVHCASTHTIPLFSRWKLKGGIKE